MQDKYGPWMDCDVKLACQNKANKYKRYVIIGRNIADRHGNVASYGANLVNDAKTKSFYNLGENIKDQHIFSKAY